MSGSGVISGGWGFVWAAYVASAVILLGYAVSIHARFRQERKRRAAGPPPTDPRP